jgi:oxygen-independent coproporphyrinogen-3 oxidase
VAGEETVASADLPVEFMLNALRLVEGVAAPLYAQRTGLPLRGIADRLTAARAHGWLESREDRLVATARGRQFLNDMLELFVPDEKVRP